MRRIFVLIAFFPLFTFCSERETKPKAFASINEIAKQYVINAHRIGKYDSDYVDAYFGPEELKQTALKDSIGLSVVINNVKQILIDLNSIDTLGQPELSKLRYSSLKRLTEAMLWRAKFLNGTKLTFDEECKYIYDAVYESKGAEHYDNILKLLNDRVPGKGDLTDRMNIFKKQFEIPHNKIDTVFKTAIAEGKRRTELNLELPEQEKFIIEYVKDKSWGAYNWYKGNAFSLIQVNTELPITIDRAIDLACHEGYPGHHVFHSLMELNMVKDSNWLEYSVYPLFSPMSLLSEGTANFGIKAAFPGSERIEFEKKVLFPLAGLDPQNVDLYYEIMELQSELRFAGNDAAKNYLDGYFTAEETVEWLMKYQLRNKESAERYLSFIEQYRAYVINYNVGLQMVENYIIRHGGIPEEPEKRWMLFLDLISNPYMPSNLLN